MRVQFGSESLSRFVGIRIYKFRMSNQLCLLSYRVLDEDSLKQLTFGRHENFYCELKKLEKLEN